MNISRNKTVSLMILVLVTLAISITAYARQQSPNFDRLADRLSLSDGQKIAFVQVMQAQHEKKRALMQQHRQQTLSALGVILDEQQLAQLQQQLEKRMHKRHANRSMNNSTH